MDLSQVTPDQLRSVMAQAQQEANQTIVQDMMKQMVKTCFERCATTSGDRLDGREQACMASCQDRYIETRAQVNMALQKRQSSLN